MFPATSFITTSKRSRVKAWVRNNKTMYKPKIVRLICGYTRTGKDTLTQRLITGRGEYKWAIYVPELISGHPDLLAPDVTAAALTTPGYRLSFGDEVKRRVGKTLGLPKTFDFEANKDLVVRDGRTFRSFCIDRGFLERIADPYTWARVAFERAELDDKEGFATISDWRFREEEEFAHSAGKVVTFRVFRQSVPVPPVLFAPDDPEHSLDKVSTNFLVVPASRHEDEFTAARHHFPQYSNFEYYTSLD
jgi:hypothetical protein